MMRTSSLFLMPSKTANDEGYSNVQIVVGSDRVAEFDSLAQKYNGELYNFEEIETISGW